MWSIAVRSAALLIALYTYTPLASTAPHTVDELLKQPSIRGADISPDGARVALAFRSDDQPGDVVGVIETARLGQPDAVTRFALGEKEVVAIDWLRWATPSRLLIGISLTSRVPVLSSKKTGTPLGSRVYSVNADGSNAIVLFSNVFSVQRYAFNLSRLTDIPANDPQHVIMPGWTGNALDLFRVNIETGNATAINKGNASTFDWDTEEGHAALRYDINARGTVVSVYGRTGEQDDWSLLTRYKRRVDKLDWEFAGDAPGAGRIYVRTQGGQSDTEAIYEYDIGTKALGKLVASVPGFDMDNALTVNGKYMGAAYIADRLIYVLADARLQKHFNGIDEYFGRSANVRIVDADKAGAYLLLYVFGPKAPGDYYVYDVARAKLQFLMSARPWLAPERLSSVEAKKLPMRDGSEITAYLTWPEAAKTPLPVLVMPHGGPEVRDFMRFDPMAQVFAAQGWLVVQPNFRGSGGYGKAFAQAGHGQWSLRMQDDITDAVEHLVELGIADRSRIAIYGASYGGYAALAGAVVTPDLYRAAVAQSGVSDLIKLAAWQGSEDGIDSQSYSYLLERIGDPKADRARMRAASPRLRAAEIRIPILLLHGSRDGIVPIEQSLMMERALKKARKDVTMITYKGEGHSGWSQANKIQSAKEIVAFLRTYLSPLSPNITVAE